MIKDNYTGRPLYVFALPFTFFSLPFLFMKTTIRKYKFFIFSGILLCLALALWVYLAPYGAHNYLALQNQCKKVSSEIVNLRKQNQALKEEINQIKNDPDYLEKIARQNFNLLKKNEMIFDFSKRKKGHKKN